MAKHENIVGSSVNASHLYDGDVWVCPAANKDGDEGNVNITIVMLVGIHPGKIDYTGHGSKTMHQRIII